MQKLSRYRKKISRLFTFPISEGHIIVTFKKLRMLMAKYQEPVYWHIRRLVVSFQKRFFFSFHAIIKPMTPE